MEILQFNNLNVVIERKSFRRSLSVYVYPDRPVTVRASRLASKKLILDFLELKKDWIEKHYMRVMSQKKMFPQRKIQSGQAFPFLGTNLILKPVITLQKKFFFSKTETELFLHIPRNDWGQKVTTENFGYLSPQIRKFYKQESILYLSSRVEHFSLLMKLKPELLRWTEARTRWGSCSSKGSIQLNWRMIVFTPAIIDYIIVHELSHLKHLNHSKHFWNFVESILPDYKERMKELKTSQMLSDFLSFSKAAQNQATDHGT